MLEYIKGKLVTKKPTFAVVDSNGIAFEILLTLPAYEILPALNEEVKIITHFHVKENPLTILLYGFSSETERECFRNIISVSGIGPKTAITILSAINFNELIKFISRGDYQALTKISGVGKKTAERLALELKDKLGKLEQDLSHLTFGDVQPEQFSKITEILSALMSLGYNRLEADSMLKKVTRANGFDEMSMEEVIRKILRG